MTRALWAVQALLALLFLFTGVMKLVTPVEEMTKQIALPGAFLHFIGIAEILGALGLTLPGILGIRPPLTPLAAACLALIVAGATAITLAGGLGAMALLPFVTFMLCVFVAWGRSRPGVFRVERSLAIQAPPEKIFPYLADFHNWAAWSPWEPRDPAMKKTYSGSPSGEGAVYEWAGNAQVGVGRMEILEADVPSRLLIKLDFLKPFEGHQNAEFTLAPSAGATNVTWAAFGPTTYLTLVMSIFCSMDALLGKDFVTGLQNLKGLSEPKAMTSV
jgi:hypothetical protein